jgi:hypothetical protein
MFGGTSLRGQMQRWMLRTSWRLLTLLVECILMIVVAVAAATSSLIRSVFYPSAVRFTDRAVLAVEDAFLKHREWSGLGLFPIRTIHQRMIVSALVWVAGTAVVLLASFLAIAISRASVPQMPSLPSLLLLFSASGIVGALCPTARGRARGDGIKLG